MPELPIPPVSEPCPDCNGLGECTQVGEFAAAGIRCRVVDSSPDMRHPGPYRGKRNDYRALSEYWAARSRHYEAAYGALAFALEAVENTMPDGTPAQVETMLTVIRLMREKVAQMDPGVSLSDRADRYAADLAAELGLPDAR